MSTVQGTSDVFLVVADPVAQVKAPLLFNRLFDLAGIDAIVVPARASAARLGAFVRESMAVPNFKGLFVSIPHKTSVMGLLDRVDDTADAAGSVNAVRRCADGSLEGALFDGAGFVSALQHHGVDVTGRRVLLVGAGGAGLAIASALARRTLASLTVFDASTERAKSLAVRTSMRTGFAVSVAGRCDPAGFDLVVHATPLGLHEHDPMPFPVERVSPHAAVFDILMTRRPTPLLAACRKRGIAAYSGHEMLIQQVPDYLDFFGFSTLAARLREPHDPWLAQARELMT